MTSLGDCTLGSDVLLDLYTSHYFLNKIYSGIPVDYYFRVNFLFVSSTLVNITSDYYSQIIRQKSSTEFFIGPIVEIII